MPKKLHTFLKPATQAERNERRYLAASILWKSLALIDIFALLYIFLGGDAAIFLTLFLAFLFFRWDNRYAGALAILSLTSCPILLSLELDGDAEQMAVYAYYFLVMTVALQIIEFKWPRKESKTELKLLTEGKKPAAILDLRSINGKKV